MHECHLTGEVTVSSTSQDEILHECTVGEIRNECHLTGEIILQIHLRGEKIHECDLKGEIIPEFDLTGEVILEVSIKLIKQHLSHHM